MNELLELKQQRAALINQCTQLVVESSKRGGMDSEETVKYDKMWAEKARLEETIKRAEELSNIDYAIKEARAERRSENGGSEDLQIAAFNNWAKFGYAELTAEQRTALKPAGAEFVTRAQSVGTGSAGGVLVPQGFYGSVLEAMKWYGGMLTPGLASAINTDAGNDIPYPTVNDTTISGAILGENTADTPQDIGAFSSVTLKAYKYTSKNIQVSIELLQDNATDVEALISRLIATRLGRIQNAHFTTGTGSGQPQGVVTAATSGKVGATGQTLIVTYNDLVDLLFSVDKAYRKPSSAWMCNDLTLRNIVKLSDTAGRPLILDYNRGIASPGEPETLLGYRIIVNNDMATMAANARSIIFGDFSNYMIRRVNGMAMLRLTERYAEFGQVAFLAFQRASGHMIDAGTNPIKFYQNSAT